MKSPEVIGDPAYLVGVSIPSHVVLGNASCSRELCSLKQRLLNLGSELRTWLNPRRTAPHLVYSTLGETRQETTLQAQGGRRDDSRRWCNNQPRLDAGARAHNSAAPPTADPRSPGHLTLSLARGVGTRILFGTALLFPSETAVGSGLDILPLCQAYPTQQAGWLRWTRYASVKTSPAASQLRSLETPEASKRTYPATPLKCPTIRSIACPVSGRTINGL